MGKFATQIRRISFSHLEKVIWKEIGKGAVERRYEAGRNGEHLLTNFQCDICHLLNIKGRSPDESDVKDKTLLETIRRLSLYTFWS